MQTDNILLYFCCSVPIESHAVLYTNMNISEKIKKHLALYVEMGAEECFKIMIKVIIIYANNLVEGMNIYFRQR